MTDGVLLDVRELTKRFGGLTVLDQVSFTMAPGEVAGVVGPNGSGKTTLLRCVAGADPADEGQVLLDGAPLDETSPLVRAAMAVVLEDVDFFPDLSVVEHLRLYAWAHGAESADVTVSEVIEDLGLTDAGDQLPLTLSSGQRQRLALASCLVRPRRLLLLDEPEQHLDTAGREWLAGRLNAERAAGTAVLLASHDSELLDATVDAVIEVGG